jgi:hypothetical protein
MSTATTTTDDKEDTPVSSTSSSSYSPHPWHLWHSLPIWSSVWLILCTSLVYKHVELILVFVTFVVCFIGSFLMMKMIMTMPQQQQQEQQQQEQQQQHHHSTTRMMTSESLANMCRRICDRIGLIVCSMAFWILAQHQSPAQPLPLSSSSSAPSSSLSSSLSWVTQSFYSTFHETSTDFLAISIVAGYLAYEHWYRTLFCRPPPKPMWVVLEDAITLSYVLVLLTMTLDDNDQHDDHGNGTTTTTSLFLYPFFPTVQSLESYRFMVTTWLMYRIIRLTFMATTPTTPSVSPETTNSVDATTAASATATTISTTTTPTTSTTSTTTTLAVSMIINTFNSLLHQFFTLNRPAIDTVSSHDTRSTIPYAWRIHNIEYDLSTFVHKHPGGAEAILLGQSRDCTALFESYHPFTTQHRKVLEKYQIVTSPPATTTSTTTTTTTTISTTPSDTTTTTTPTTTTPVDRNDFFYDILCERVEKVLKDHHHMDPIRDRCATTARWCYYCFVVTMTILTGYWHCQVRTHTYKNGSLQIHENHRFFMFHKCFASWEKNIML